MSIALVCVPVAASMPAHCEDAVASIGKQRAAASVIEWEVRDLNHPLMGSIKAAVQLRPIATVVKGRKVMSTAFVSCQKSIGKIALELASSDEDDPRGGLGPVDLPRLICNGAGPKADGVLVKSDLAASWEIGALGDTLARGLSPAALRRCASIDVLQNVALPPGWPQQSQRIAMELTPYGRALDAVFTACGETTAFAPAERPAVQAQVAQPVPPPKLDPTLRSIEAPWKPARTIAKGKTNIRSAARLDSAVVVQLDPGARILIQQASKEWWKVKPRSGASFGGYIRRDRFTFE